jgi:hypothetical protein
LRRQSSFGGGKLRPSPRLANQKHHRGSGIGSAGASQLVQEENSMAIAAHTVAINAAFLQEIKDDHHELRQLMHHVQAMLQRPIWMTTEHTRLVDLLGKLRDQLAMHFSLEEAFGYFEDAIIVAPHLSKRADALRSQHAKLYSDLSALAERAESLCDEDAGLPVDLVDGYRAFAQSFIEHESHEGELILEAFNSDIGTGD